jgi:parvulin-like peptidyl-prolyl isomerase
MNIEQSARRATPAALRLAAVAACIAAALQVAPAAAQAAPAAAQATPAAAASPHAAAPAAVFARVGEHVISADDYDAAFNQAARNKFYHGKPPEAEVALLQREVGQKLVDEILLAEEAKRRNLKPDAAAIQKAIAGYDQRYKDSPQWAANRPRVLPQLVAKLERDDVLEQLTKAAKTVPAPTEAQLQKFYEDHKDKFTSPEQVHIRMILLKVDPSSPKDRWDSAMAEGAAIVKRLRAGAKFEELAELHSNDESAKRGGDMGYLHRGMLPDPAQKAVDALKPGDLSEAVLLLEGVAVIRLEGRKEPVLNSLETVRARASDLYLRDRGEEAWSAFLAKLRSAAAVQLDESRYLPLASTGATAPAR